MTSFLARAGRVSTETATPIYSFALMPNHFHLLVRRGEKPLSLFMQKLLGPYAQGFNKRHKRSGYLFENRYKAIVCQEDAYFAELVRYIHLNPLRSGIVADISALDNYPFCGHSFVLRNSINKWFDPDTVLGHFGETADTAVASYAEFVLDGIDAESPSFDKPTAASPARRQDDRRSDNRILGDEKFANELLRSIPKTSNKQVSDPNFQQMIASTCDIFQVSQAELVGKTKQRRIVEARTALAFGLSQELGLTRVEIGKLLNVTATAVTKMIARGESWEKTS